MERVSVDVVVVGGGVVGLAVAERLSAEIPGIQILLVERHAKLGQESSSRNSEVIHAGIYYDGAPLKGSTCVRGRELLYEFCVKHGVPHRNCGKWIVSTDRTQEAALDKIFRFAATQGVPLEERAVETARAELDNPSLTRALWSPTTGIVDSHSLMLKLEALAHSRGVLLQYGTKLSDLAPKRGGGFTARLSVDGQVDEVLVECRALVNSAGLSAAFLAQALRPAAGFEIRPCRGRYFSMASRYSGRYRSLVYPVPDPAGGLGVHLTIDMQGRCRLGPDVDWAGSAGLSCDDPALYRFGSDTESLRREFLASGRRLVPDLELQDIEADYIGARPKLFVGGTLHKDFLILEGSDSAIHLLGIESPGLTASLALAEIVAGKTRKILA